MKNNIKAIRKHQKLSQAELGAAMGGVTEVQISRLENGRVQLTEDWLYRLAKALHCHWSELLGNEPLMSDEERNLLGKVRSLSDAQREAILKMAEAFEKE